ncbi:MAG: ribosome small subunit-dependent GTPase A [Chlamydiae bacterium]|nr:ribosome small subunit-dependent GTPase A [Chlamydiota bacterium]
MSDYESFEFEETRRDFKKERKLFTKQDRSKYKKTDQEKIVRPDLKGEIGRVISLEPSTYFILTSDDQLITATLKGTLKLEKTRNNNMIAIGDFVEFTRLKQDQGIITGIKQRKSVLARAKDKHRHLIAANVDQVLIVSSATSPNLKISLIDRYIIATRQGNMDPVIVINKIDLIDPQDPILQEVDAIYSKLNIPVIKVSAYTKEGMKDLRLVMENKTSVFSGQSGVGKTSLINEITSSNLRVGDIVKKTQKGAHTTTKATLIPLLPSGFCIDTPGIKSFGIWELSIEEIQNYFTDFLAYPCKFPDCMHIHEPGCGVKEALENGSISLHRYQSYITLIEEVQNEHHQTR